MIRRPNESMAMKEKRKKKKKKNFLQQQGELMFRDADRNQGTSHLRKLTQTPVEKVSTNYFSIKR